MPGGDGARFLLSAYGAGADLLAAVFTRHLARPLAPTVLARGGYGRDLAVKNSHGGVAEIRAALSAMPILLVPAVHTGGRLGFKIFQGVLMFVCARGKRRKTACRQAAYRQNYEHKFFHNISFPSPDRVCGCYFLLLLSPAKRSHTLLFPLIRFNYSIYT